jgi:hypothetical protein
MWLVETCPECGPGLSLLKSDAMQGDSPVHGLEFASYGLLSESRIAWECNLNGSWSLLR